MRPISRSSSVKRILVVDDDVLMADLIARALSDCEVLIAHTAKEALALAQPGIHIDLLITDYLMPSMLGDELLGRLRQRRPHLRALVVTGYVDILNRERPTWWATQPHLPKPFTVAALRESVFGLIGPAASA